MGLGWLAATGLMAKTHFCGCQGDAPGQAQKGVGYWVSMGLSVHIQGLGGHRLFGSDGLAASTTPDLAVVGPFLLSSPGLLSKLSTLTMRALR